MLLDSSAWASTARYLTWKPKATKQGRLYFQLAPSAPRTNESEFLFWPTPDTQNHRDGSVTRKEAKGRHAVSLHHAIHLWPTPTANGNNNRKGISKKAGDGLATAVKMWPTPCATEARQGLQIRRNGKAGKQQSLSTAVQLWPTPSASDCGRTAINPVVTKNGTIRHQNKQGGQSFARLDQVAAMFPTPTTRDYKSPDMNPHSKRFMKKTELNSAIGGQLNPEWVEWLMGFPTGWTA